MLSIALAFAVMASAGEPSETRPARELQRDTATADVPSSPRPSGNPGNWANANDYPTAALREEAEGVSRFTLAVDATGVPTGCEITGSSGYDSLDERTCEVLLARARFEPALDAKRNPVAGTWSSSVRWEIPRDSHSAPLPIDITITYIVERDGSVSDCSYKGLENFVQGRGPCDVFAAQEFDPPLDANGQPVRRKVVMHNVVTNEDLPD